jgi:hypothetical protein
MNGSMGLYIAFIFSVECVSFEKLLGLPLYCAIFIDGNYFYLLLVIVV